MTQPQTPAQLASPDLDRLHAEYRNTTRERELAEDACFAFATSESSDTNEAARLAKAREAAATRAQHARSTLLAWSPAPETPAPVAPGRCDALRSDGGTFTVFQCEGRIGHDGPHWWGGMTWLAPAPPVAETAFLAELNRVLRSRLRASHTHEEIDALFASVTAALTPRETAPGGVALIAAERWRQVTAEGWAPEHDDGHRLGELADAAACYAAAANNAVRGFPPGPVPDRWPFEPAWWKPAAFDGGKVKAGGPNPDIPPAAIANLVKAGALIAAEIDRLQRAAGGAR